MRSPHKWAKEIYAIADGKQVQWARDYNEPVEWNDFDPAWDSSPISSSDGIIWRIKTPEVDQWRKDLAQALVDGKVVEVLINSRWCESTVSISRFLDPTIIGSPYKDRFRIKPEPKPDFETFLCKINHQWHAFNTEPCHKGWAFIKLIWDGETGKLKDAEVLN